MSKRPLRQLSQLFKKKRSTYVPPTSDEGYITSDDEDTSSDEEFTLKETKRLRKDRSPSTPKTPFDVLLAKSRTLSDNPLRIAAIDAVLRPLLRALTLAKDTDNADRLALVRDIVETALLLIAEVGEPDAAAFVLSLREEMVVLSDGVLSYFAQHDELLALVIGKGEHYGESAMTGVGGSTAEMVAYVQKGLAALDVKAGIFDANPVFSAPLRGVAGGRFTSKAPEDAVKLSDTLLGLLLAIAGALGNRFVYLSHMISGDGLKDDTFWLYPLLLRDEARAALVGVRGVTFDVDVFQSIGVDGGKHWSACWTRDEAMLRPAMFLLETACAVDALESQSTGAAGASSSTASSLFQRAMSAAHVAAETSGRQFGALSSTVFAHDVAEHLLLFTPEGDDAASSAILRTTMGIYMEELSREGVTVADLTDRLRRGIGDFAAGGVAASAGAGAALAGLTAIPTTQLGGFQTHKLIFGTHGELMKFAENACAGLEQRDPPPILHTDEVLVASLIKSFETSDEVFNTVDEYGNYILLVLLNGVIVHVYGGSSGRPGYDLHASLEKRQGKRNSIISSEKRGVGDSNIAICLAALCAAVAEGVINKNDVEIQVLVTGFKNVPVGAYPAAFGGAHCLGLYGEQIIINFLRKYKVCANKSTVSLALGEGRFTTESAAAAGAS